MATQQTNQGMGTAAGDGSGGAMEKAQEIVGQTKEQLQQTTGEVKQKASERARTQLDNQSNRAGEQIASIAQALHLAAEHLERDGNTQGAQAAHQAGQQTQRLARYFKESNADRFLSDIEQFSRNRPWVAGGFGAAAGFFAARFLKASSEGRYASTQTSRVDSETPMNREFEATTPIQAPVQAPIQPPTQTPAFPDSPGGW